MSDSRNVPNSVAERQSPVASPAKRRSLDPDEAPPLLYVAAHVLSADSPYSTAERMVGLALADRVGSNRMGKCWPSKRDLAERTGLSPSTVARALKTLCNEDSPLFSRGWERDPKTGRWRRTPTYTLVRHPAAFKAARDKRRAAELERKVAEATGTGPRSLEDQEAKQEAWRERILQQARQLEAEDRRRG